VHGVIERQQHRVCPANCSSVFTWPVMLGMLYNGGLRELHLFRPVRDGLKILAVVVMKIPVFCGCTTRKTEVARFSGTSVLTGGVISTETEIFVSCCSLC
jgi:hypothetical protein